MADQDYSYKDIHDTPVEILAQDTVTTETPVVEERKEVVETPILTADEIASKTADEIESRRVAEAEEQEKKEAAEAKEKEDAYKTWEDELWESEKRTPTYREALDFMQKQAANDPETINKLYEAFKGKQQEEAKVVEAEQVKVKEAEAKSMEQFNAQFDDELMEIYRSGALTPIQDPNNPSDQGVVEKRALAQRWYEVNQQRVKEGKPEIRSAARIVYGRDEAGKPYFSRPNAQPAGADAPIMGNKSSAIPPSSERGYTYKDLKAPWSGFGK